MAYVLELPFMHLSCYRAGNTWNVQHALQTRGERWRSTQNGFFSSSPGDVGLVELFTDTLEIIETDAAAAAGTPQGCSLLQIASVFRLTARLRPWCARSVSKLHNG